MIRRPSQPIAPSSRNIRRSPPATDLADHADDDSIVAPPSSALDSVGEVRSSHAVFGTDKGRATMASKISPSKDTSSTKPGADDTPMTGTGEAIPGMERATQSQLSPVTFEGDPRQLAPVRLHLKPNVFWILPWPPMTHGLAPIWLRLSVAKLSSGYAANRFEPDPLRRLLGV